ncbi:MAG: methyltransferase domain-containing protein [Candidatus Eiseniibacteriota bacterium]
MASTLTREARILALVDRNGAGLEIGPSFRPLVPKSAGGNVKIADHADAETLRTKYREVPGASERIEDVDFVMSGGLAQSIPLRSHFDWIVASHVIEHVADLVGFLSDCELLLKPGGVLALAVPDKRFCFDAARGISGLGEVMRAHAERRTKPDRHDVLDYHMNTVSRGGVFGWHEGYGEPLTLLYDSTEWAVAQSKRADAEFVDVHIWRFTPSSFRLVIEDLRALGEIRLREADFSDTVEHEFYVSLRTTGSGPRLTRLQLLARIIEECRHC